MTINNLILRIKRGETPAYRLLRTVLKAILAPRAPRLPSFLKPLFRLLYELHFGFWAAMHWFAVAFYRHPLFQARCASLGRNLTIDSLPWVEGHCEIHVGNDVLLSGLSVTSGRFLDRPKLVIKDRTQIGSGVGITVSQSVIIEEDVKVSFRCRISDSDGHPRQADLRAQNAPVDPRDIRPVRICRYAWIGNNSQIMKGVTIGEGAVIGANSVVISDIPAYSLAMGNPAEVYFRNYGRPLKKAAAAQG